MPLPRLKFVPRKLLRPLTWQISAKTSAWKKCWVRERIRSRSPTKKRLRFRRWRARRFKGSDHWLVVKWSERQKPGVDIRPARVVRRGSKFVRKHLIGDAVRGVFCGERRCSKLRLYESREGFSFIWVLLQ